MNHYLRRFITLPRHAVTFLYQIALITESVGLLSLNPSQISFKFLEFQAYEPLKINNYYNFSGNLRFFEKLENIFSQLIYVTGISRG